MATQTTSRNSSSSLLRRALQGDGIFELFTGLLLVVGAQPIATLLGLNVPIVLIAIGMIILLYGAFLLVAATRGAVNSRLRRLAIVTAILNGAWAIASLIALVTNLIPFTTEGKWIVCVVAIIVATFAELQLHGVWRTR